MDGSERGEEGFGILSIFIENLEIGCHFYVIMSLTLDECSIQLEIEVLDDAPHRLRNLV